MTRRQNGLNPFGPFKNSHSLAVQNIIDPHRLGFFGAADAIKIKMIKTSGIRLTLMFMRQIIARAGQRNRRPPALADAAAEDRLAGADITRKTNPVPRPQQLPQRRAELFGQPRMTADDV